MSNTVTALRLLTAPNLKVPHGFTTRQGGVSGEHFASLNLGLSTGDNRRAVEANRDRVLARFGVTRDQALTLEQVHSARVVVAEPGWYALEADAAVTDKPDLLLVISVADCVPLLLHNPVRRVIGAAHAGWRGTVKGVARNVVETLRDVYGSAPEDLQVAIGPSIQGACYQVGSEVVAEFERAGFPAHIYKADNEGRYRLDVAGANRHLLEKAGVAPEQIVDLGLCTHCDPQRFYSHRRDGLKRGSHWAAIRLAG